MTEAAIKCGQTEMKATVRATQKMAIAVNSILSEQEETIRKEVEDIMSCQPNQQKVEAAIKSSQDEMKVIVRATQKMATTVNSVLSKLEEIIKKRWKT
jgi:hypothetical protein